jgi:hypothetical protein
MKSSRHSPNSLYEGGKADIMDLDKADSDIDNIDFNDFKGIYFAEDGNDKY